MSHSAPTGVSAGVPLADVDQDLLDGVAFDSRGLVTVVVQEAESRDVLMVAYMDREALRRTLDSGRTWFYSRSRNEYWLKGETSGDRQFVTKMSYDCDGDALLIQVVQEGKGACHTGAYSCFFRDFGELD